MNKELIYIDLFSGVGGFAKGFQDAGVNIKHHYFSEIDKNAIAVYKYQFKNAEYVGSVTDVSGTELRRKHPGARFIITFGFPCQDLSIAGKGKGLSGERSGLFFEAIRIVKEVKPEVFIFENVKGLLSSNEGKDFETVLRTIADIGLYECEWQLINTRWVLPQNRERVYFLGHLSGRSRPRVFPFRKTDFRVNERISNPAISRAITAGGHSGGHSGGHHSGMTLISNSGLSRKYEVRNIVPPLRANTGVGHNDFIIQKTRGDSVSVKKDIAGTLQAGGANDMDKVPNVIQINPSKESGGSQPYQQNRVYSADGISPALNSELSGRNNIFIDSGFRRFTEIECERLQGFPDNWTQYGDYDGKIKKVAKTQRYKQMGNAVTTNWPCMIAERLFTNKQTV